MSFQIVISVGDQLEVACGINPPTAQVPIPVALGALEQAKFLLCKGMIAELAGPEKKVIAAPAGTLRQLPPRMNGN